MQYTALTAVLHPRDAVRADAPLIHENLADYQRDSRVQVIPNSDV